MVVVLKRAVFPFLMLVILGSRNVRMILAASLDEICAIRLGQGMQVNRTDDTERQSQKDTDHH